MSTLVKGIYIIPFLALLLNTVGLPIIVSMQVQKPTNPALQNLLYGTAALDALFLGTLIWMALQLNKRIFALKQNVERFEQAQPLYNQIEGDDELSQIDLCVHKVSERHDETVSFRRSVMKLMAHDLRTPITSNILALDLVADTEKDISEPSRSRLKQVRNSLERQLNLLNNLLLIEQLESGQVELTQTSENLAELIAKSLDGLSSAAKIKNISFELNTEPTYAMLDREKILLVLGSYLSNAIKFSPTGGRIIVRLIKNEEQIRVEVQDQGVGVKEEESVKLFQKFSQSVAGRKAGGAGLSLAIGKKIIEAHGGEVGVFSKSEHGSTFWFSVPAPKTDDSNGMEP